MEQWRSQENKWRKLLLMWLSAIALGGCGIWCMHFTGMNAVEMALDDGTILEVNFEGITTLISLIAPIVGVFLGLRIASTDPFFLEVEASRRKDLLVSSPCDQ
jgi:NO-binding membrane sensor protein with MHYT domain